MHDTLSSPETLADRIKALEMRLAALERRHRTNVAHAGTHLDIVKRVLQQRLWSTVAEIAKIGQLDERAVRAVLYGHQGNIFTCERLSPRRIRWSLAATRREAVVAMAIADDFEADRFESV